MRTDLSRPEREFCRDHLAQMGVPESTIAKLSDKALAIACAYPRYLRALLNATGVRS